MDKVNFFLASLFAATAVAAGAFGAHGLQRLTAEATVIQTYQTAVQYHFWHAIALLLAGLLAPYGKPQLNYWARQSFLAGLICLVALFICSPIYDSSSCFLSSGLFLSLQ